MAKVKCDDCRNEYAAKRDGTPYKHTCRVVLVDDCEVCGGSVPLREDGVLITHLKDVNDPSSVCDGSPALECDHRYEWADDGTHMAGSFCVHCGQEEPAAEEPRLCGGCGEPAPSHDEWCQLDQRPVSVAAATVESMDETPKPDPFESPATVERVAGPTGVIGYERETNVSGQPEPLRDQWGRYLLPNPATGLYSDGGDKATRRNGWTRATTFAKAAADTFALTRYDERLTLVGATLRPDVVALAHGKQVREDAKELNQLVLQIKDAAGAKVAANHGTAVHSFTERIDAGLMKAPEVPEAYRPMVVAYREKLKEAGLEVVPGLIERTTFVNRWNGLCGTLDRVLYHRPSGTYLIGDVKTGRDLSYGRMEIAVQLALYAHGVNEHGVYDWNQGEWQPAGSYGDSVETGPWQVPKVRTDYGVVMHLPIQGDDAGQCFLKRVNLASGWEVSQVCGDVLASRKRGDYMEDGLDLPGVPYVPETPDHQPTPTLAETDWESMFRAVPTKEAASHLWREAKAEGVAGMELQRLVGLAQQRLRELGVSG